MLKPDLYKLKYPIGEFIKPQSIDAPIIKKWIGEIESFPERVNTITEGLSVAKANWRYRPNGWTIKQVVHHCGDSHINSFMRFKLVLTEDFPAIRPYFEDKWAELPDSLDDDLKDSILLLKGLHRRWVKLLKSLTESDLKKEFIHPEHGMRFSLDENIGIYAWHCNHHLAHIKQAIKAKGTFN
jgi:DinB superfamily